MASVFYYNNMLQKVLFCIFPICQEIILSFKNSNILLYIILQVFIIIIIIIIFIYIDLMRKRCQLINVDVDVTMQRTQHF